MIILAHALNGLLMIAMPVAVGIYLTRRFKLGWTLWFIGAGTFIMSQVGHIPFNLIVDRLFDKGVFPALLPAFSLHFNAIFLGLSSGLWEEGMRYVMYRWWAKDARGWGKGLLAGAGHGGAEAIILGALVLLTFVNMLIARSADLASLVPAEQLALAEQQVAIYWSASWPEALLGALERFFTIPFHLALSLLVMQVFIRQQIRWLWMAVGLHALANGLVVYTLAWGWSSYAIEGVVGVAWLVALAIIYLLREPEPELETVPLVEIPAKALVINPVEETSDNLEESRYQ